MLESNSDSSISIVENCPRLIAPAKVISLDLNSVLLILSAAVPSVLITPATALLDSNVAYFVSNLPPFTYTIDFCATFSFTRIVVLSSWVFSNVILDALELNNAW